MTSGGQSKRVLDELRSQVVTGAIAPGVTMSQTELAARFGVSRIPLREILPPLASEGLIRIGDGGAVTTTPLSVAELQEIYEIRENVEPLLTKIAVPNVGRAEVLRMRTVLARMQETSDTWEWLTLNAQFHGIPYQCAHRPRLLGLVNQYRALADRYIYVLVEVLGNAKEIDRQHAGILEAVAAGDAKAAAELTRQHLADSHAFVLSYLLEKD
ncbi:GntR family transcriptional regulator [Mycobacterium sp. MS1601]|uniref:GntR family transcriptional regulator n=1 Tax=Mycobacterium sp. MS1601 TaxID=1936029 RepID=UPI00178CED34|nr:GntR family transcriptional regulator [Mycobacterium sp. MS1601]